MCMHVHDRFPCGPGPPAKHELARRGAHHCHRLWGARFLPIAILAQQGCEAKRVLVGKADSELSPASLFRVSWANQGVAEARARLRQSLAEARQPPVRAMRHRRQ